MGSEMAPQVTKSLNSVMISLLPIKAKFLKPYFAMINKVEPLVR